MLDVVKKLILRLDKVRKRAIKSFRGRFALAWGREHAVLVITASMLGVLGAYGAIGFRKLIGFVHKISFGTDEYSLEVLADTPWWLRLLLPVVGGVLVGIIVKRFSPEVKGSGIPEVMEAVARKGGAIRFRVVVTKAVAAALTIGTGGSAGREGPIIHIGSAIGSAVGQFFQVSAKRMRTFVACGAAAGIAATFNAPIAGALFAIEVVLGDLRVSSMSPIVISSVVATVISRHFLGDFPAFEVPGYDLVSPLELVLYGGMGIVAGLTSVVFIKMLYWVADLFEKLPIPAWGRPGIGGLGVGIMAIWMPHVFGVGYSTINAALWGKSDIAISHSEIFLPGILMFAVLVFAKILATSFTLGSGGSGGIFAPSLFIGATLGATYGMICNYFFPDWTAQSGAYALVGMGAVVSAATHAPITAILIIFELTNDYRVIPPLMITSVIAVLLSSYLSRESIYTKKLQRKGVKLSEGKDVNLLKSIVVKSVMEKNVQCISAGTPITVLLPALLSGSRPSAIIVDATEKYLGSVELGDVREVVSESEDLASLVVAADVADTQAPFVVPADTLDMVMRLFGSTHRDEIPVCKSLEDLSVLGVVTKKAVIDAYNSRLFQADLSSGFGSIVDAASEGRSVEVMEGVQMTEVDVPASWVGKDLREADPRQKHGVTVVLIHREINDEQGIQGVFPSPDVVFNEGDKVLLMGDTASIWKFQR